MSCIIHAILQIRFILGFFKKCLSQAFDVHVLIHPYLKHFSFNKKKNLPRFTIDVILN